MKLPQRLCTWLSDRLRQNRAPDFIVGDPPYLLRWWIIPRNRWCNVYLHVFLKDDDDRACHDHPWASLSILLTGVLEEVYLDGKEERRRFIRQGAITYRSATFAHRLIVTEKHTTTLFITGPVVRKWGFYCPNGWRHWRDFTAPGDKGRVGRGCD